MSADRKEMSERVDRLIRSLSKEGYDTDYPGFIALVDEIRELIGAKADLVSAQRNLTSLEMAAHSYTLAKIKEQKEILHAASRRPIPDGDVALLKDGTIITVVPVTNEITKALCCLVWTTGTREYLHEHDPKALAQADKALKDAGYTPACGWDNLDKEGE